MTIKHLSKPLFYLSWVLALASGACVGAGGGAGVPGELGVPEVLENLGGQGATQAPLESSGTAGTPERPGQTASIIPQDLQILSIPIKEDPCRPKAEDSLEFEQQDNVEENAEEAQDPEEELADAQDNWQQPCLNSKDYRPNVEVRTNQPAQEWANPQDLREDLHWDREADLFE